MNINIIAVGLAGTTMVTSRHYMLLRDILAWYRHHYWLNITGTGILVISLPHIVSVINEQKALLSLHNG